MSTAVATTCPYCGVGCGVRAERRTGAVQISGDPAHPANNGRLCTKGAMLGETLDLEGRLLHPTVNARRVSWESALDAVAAGFRRTIERHGPDAVALYVSGQLLTEDYYVANKLMKGFIGRANIDTNSRLCMASAVAGHLRAFGEDLVPTCYEDLELADLVVLAGSNTASCHPVLFQRLRQARERRPEMKVVVIDPRRTPSAEGCDLHLAVQPGSDVALFNGLLSYLAGAGFVDDSFIEAHAAGAEAALAAAREDVPDIASAARACGLEEEDVSRFFGWFAEHERVVTMFSQGINQSSSGTDKVNAIINAHLLTGRIGRPGMGPFSVTGQPNAMGGREVGGLASTLAAHMDFAPENVDRLRRFWNSPNVASSPGLKAVDLFDAVGAGRIRALWIMATNPAVSLPDAGAVRRALRGCEFVVVSDCMARTDTTDHAHVLLPAAAWGEKDGTVTNSERRISRQRAFLDAPGEARPDWWIITQVARRLGYAEAFPYESPAEIFGEHARLSGFENDGRRRFDISGLAGLSEAEYDALTPVQWPVTAAERIGRARMAATDLAAQPDGRVLFIPVRSRSPVHLPTTEFPLILNSGRVRDQWHSMTRSGKSPRLSALAPESFVAVHPDDAAAAELSQGMLAEVATRWGRAVLRVSIDTGLRPGEIFAPIHWSDQNSAHAAVGRLGNPAVDPLSGEPEFKYTPARLRPWPAAWHGFLLSRIRLAAGAGAGIDYWSIAKTGSGWCVELAGREPRVLWSAWARRWIGAAGPDADWLEYSDPQVGDYRLARIDGGQLAACLFTAREYGRLPPRDALIELFARTEVSTSERTSILAGGGFGKGGRAVPAVGTSLTAAAAGHDSASAST